MHKFVLIGLMLLVAACARTSAIPLGNNMVEINVSGPGIMKRADTQQIAIQKAAQATIDMGFDKFMVVNSDGWNESGFQGGSYGSFGANQQQAQAQWGSYQGSTRNPESKLLIKMLKATDKGADKAVDARAVLAAANAEGMQ